MSDGAAPSPGRRRRDGDVVKIHGLRATAAVLAHRPEAVVRAYVDESARGVYGDALRALAQRRVAYRLVAATELDRVAGARHHEGICLLVRPRPTPDLEAWLAGCPPAALALALDGVTNPHNVGAIARSAAHFGVAGLWATTEVSPHGAAARVAEGAFEVLPTFSGARIAPVLARLARAGFAAVGASPDAARSVYDVALPRRTLFVLGSEQGGLSEELRGALEEVVRVPGTGAVESLNVSVTAGVLMAEWARQRAAARRR